MRLGEGTRRGIARGTLLFYVRCPSGTARRAAEDGGPRVCDAGGHRAVRGRPRHPRMRGQTRGVAGCEDAVTGIVERGEGLVLTVRDRLLLGLWLLPVALGLVVGLYVGDDDGTVMLFVTGLVAALYVAVLVSTVHTARRRRIEPAAETAPEPPGHPEHLGHPEHTEPAAGHGPGPDPPGAPGESGRALAASRVLPLVLAVSAAVYVVAEGGWTFVVVAVQLVTVITMAAYVHERGAEPKPVT